MGLTTGFIFLIRACLHFGEGSKPEKTFVMATKVVHKGHTCKGCKSAPLDTLAQLATIPKSDGLEDFSTQAITTISDRASLVKRARRKYMTNGYTLALVSAEEQNPESSLRKAYWNTYHCAGSISLKNDGKVSGKYCKNRWCLVCNSIRTAQLMEKYLPELDSWENKHFVTLTIPNVEAPDLKASIELMQFIFNRIKKRISKRAERGKGESLKGIRKLEVTYNPERNDFHPHYHVILNSRENAAFLHRYWLKEYNRMYFSSVWGKASFKAQDVRKADEKSTRELFKYFTKVISGKEKGKRMIYADAMDVMFNAVKGKRVFQNFGFKVKDRPLSDEERAEKLKEAKERKEAYAVAHYEWNQEKGDWETSTEYKVDPETGEVEDLPSVLSGYVPGDKIKELVTDKVVYRRNHSWKRWARSAPTYPNKKRECANTPAVV